MQLTFVSPLVFFPSESRILAPPNHALRVIHRQQGHYDLQAAGTKMCPHPCIRGTRASVERVEKAGRKGQKGGCRWRTLVS